MKKAIYHNRIKTLFKKILYKEHKSHFKQMEEKEFIKLKKIKPDNKTPNHISFIFDNIDTMLYLFKLLKTLITNEKKDNYSNYEDDTIVYLIICSAGTYVDNTKSEYKQYFTELRMRNAYDLLKIFVNFLNSSVYLINFFVSKKGKYYNNIIEAIKADFFIIFIKTFIKEFKGNSLSEITEYMNEKIFYKFSEEIINMWDFILKNDKTFNKTNIKDIKKDINMLKKYKNNDVVHSFQDYLINEGD